MKYSAASRIESLWTSGEIWRQAALSVDAMELAARLDMGRGALEKGLGRLRQQGHHVPNLTTILIQAKYPGRDPPRNDFLPKESTKERPLYREPVERIVRETRHGTSLSAIDEWDEPTNPGVPDLGGEITDLGIANDLGDIAKDVGNADPVEGHRLKRRIAELETTNRELMDQLLNTRDALGVAKEAASHRVSPLEFREHRSGRREACSLVVISDNHVDETVEAASVSGLNEHTPDIARARMARIFEGARWLTQHARQSHLVRNIKLLLIGDHISGTIHADLCETNSMSLPESVAFSEQLLGDGIDHLLDDPDTEAIDVHCSTGNHGRLAPGKPRIHTRNETNAETILFLSLARRFANEPRVKFDLPAGVFSYFEVYGRTVRHSHGDHLKYGGALGGLTNPINRAIARMNLARKADLDLFGHWHTYQDNGNWIVNGSTVGYGTFSEWIHAPYERPQQAWALLDSKRWRSLSAPIWCDEIEEASAA